MVFYFKALRERGAHKIRIPGRYLESFLIPELISCRFHVDKMSSAHVYLRLPKGQNNVDVVERTPDLKVERELVNAAERAERKQFLRENKRREELDKLEKDRQAELRSYKNLIVAEKTSNKDIASSNLEEDFM